MQENEWALKNYDPTGDAPNWVFTLANSSNCLVKLMNTCNRSSGMNSLKTSKGRRKKHLWMLSYSLMPKSTTDLTFKRDN